MALLFLTDQEEMTMKKIYSMIAVLAVAGIAVSCQQKETVVPDEPLAGELVPMTFSVSSEDATKTSVSGTDIIWADTDQIRVYDDKGGDNVFSAKSVSGSTAKFEGEVAEGAASFWAAYPASAATGRAGDVITTVIPAEQTLASGEFVAKDALVTVAKGSGDALSFKNAFALVAVEVAADDIAQIKVSAIGGESIAGTAAVSVGSVPSVALSAASSVVTLKPSGSTFAAGTYYVVIAPDVALSAGLAVTLDKGTSPVVGYRQSSSIATIERSHRVSFGSTDDFYSGYAITDGASLKAWHDTESNREADALLLADIDVKDAVGGEWTPVDFSHDFLGFGHKLYDIQISNSGAAYVGFIGTLTGNISNVVFGSSDGINADGTSKITVSSSSASHRVGIIGNAGAVVAKYTRVTNFVPIDVESGFTGDIRVGGILGDMSVSGGRPSMYNCTNYGDITVKGLKNSSSIGGLYGRSNKDVTIEDCANYGDVTVDATSVTISSETFFGGIAGYHSTATMNNVENYGAVNITCGGGPLKIGGIVGMIGKSTLHNLSNSGNVTSQSHDGLQYVGGLIGYALNDVDILIGEDEATKCVNSGTVSIGGAAANVTDQSCIGGIVAYTYHTGSAVSKCEVSYAENGGAVKMTSGFIAGKTYYIGGIGGHYYGPVLKGCVNKGKISVESSSAINATFNVGGILGTQRPTAISACVNNGEVYLSGVTGSIRAGGIVGHMANAVNSIGDDALGNHTTNSGKVWSDYVAEESNTWVAFGGIAGFTDGGSNHSVVNAVNKGVVDLKVSRNGGYTQAAGIVGRANTFDVISGCVNSGTIVSDNPATANGNCYAGGIIGYLPSAHTAYDTHKITSCTNSGSVTAISATRTNTSLAAGGIAGWSYADIDGCTNEGNINSKTNNYAGAIVGVARDNNLTNNVVYRSGLLNGGAPNESEAAATVKGVWGVNYSNSATATGTAFKD